VLWVVYDEMDQRTTFDQRPADLQLPAFDRLRAESFSASSALPPADRTERSMPAYLTGLRVEDARLVGRNQLRLHVQGRQDPFVWTAADTIFADARAMGVNTGLAGFFLPYCAMVGDSVTKCDWQPCVTCGRITGVFGNTVGESMWHQASELLPQYGRRRHRAAFTSLQQASLALASDPSIGFALLHLPVPHEPGIYDRTQGAFGLRPPPGDGYIHNLALADRSLGELRAAIERAGLSDKTTVMVFGDHGRRSHKDGESIADKRVPFLIKMAGQAQGIAYPAPIEVLRVHDLTLEILAGRVVTTSDLVAWLGR
jgi:Sulfatase